MIKWTSKLEIKFIKLLLSTYQYEQELNNLNFNIIHNIKNAEKIFKSNKIEIFDRVYKEGNKYIFLIHNLQNIKPNSFKTNFKTLNYHTGDLSLVSKLNDGRLISCSFDNSLNIYKNESYELQLSIKEHTDVIILPSFNWVNE